MFSFAGWTNTQTILEFTVEGVAVTIGTNGSFPSPTASLNSDLDATADFGLIVGVERN